jgi:CheY-like chemotaxis protein
VLSFEGTNLGKAVTGCHRRQRPFPLPASGTLVPPASPTNRSGSERKIPATWNARRANDCDAENVRLLIVDDSREFLDAARAVLESEGLEVVGVASTSSEALEQVGALRPDVTLVDIDLGDESGFDVVHRLAAASDPPTRLVLVSSHAEEDFSDLIDGSPVAGFISKSNLSAEAIRQALNGR